MNAPSTKASPLGVGIYSREEASRFIGVTPTRLRRWVGGYTYQYRYRSTKTRRRRPPVVATDLPVLDDTIALSFVELMELRVVSALRDKGVSLQHIRKAADLAGEYFHTEHPFASRRVYTDSRRVFTAIGEHAQNSDYLELSRSRISQIIAGGILEPFLTEIDFDSVTHLTDRWWPLGRKVPVVLDPKIAFGAPIVHGTRLRTSFLADLAKHSGLEDVSHTYRVPVEGVKAAMRFEEQLRAA